MAIEQVRADQAALQEPACFGRARLLPSRRPVPHNPARQEARPTEFMAFAPGAPPPAAPPPSVPLPSTASSSAHYPRHCQDAPNGDLHPRWASQIGSQLQWIQLDFGQPVTVDSMVLHWEAAYAAEVAMLHRCDADGGNLHALLSNNEHDNTPWPLPDGRILYTRWEYVDRSQVDYHHLWAINPDGTGQTVFFGNLHPGDVMIEAKPVPGSDTILASFSPGHGQTEHEGAVVLVDPRAGPDTLEAARYLTRTSDFRDPWPVAESLFLAARGNALVALDDQGSGFDSTGCPRSALTCPTSSLDPSGCGRWRATECCRPAVRPNRRSTCTASSSATGARSGISRRCSAGSCHGLAVPGGARLPPS